MPVEEIVRKSVFEIKDKIGRKIGRVTQEYPHPDIVGSLEVDDPSIISKLRFVVLDDTAKIDFDRIVPNAEFYEEIQRGGYFAIKSKSGQTIGFLLYDTSGPELTGKAGLITYTEIDKLPRAGVDGPHKLCREDVFNNGVYAHSYVNVPLVPLRVDHSRLFEQEDDAMKMLRGFDIMEKIAFPDGIGRTKTIDDKYKIPRDIKTALQNSDGYKPRIEQLVGAHL